MFPAAAQPTDQASVWDKETVIRGRSDIISSGIILKLGTEVFKGSKSLAGLSSSVLQQCQSGPRGPSLVTIPATRVPTQNWVNISFPMLVFGAECYHSPRALKCLIHCHNCFICPHINLSSKNIKSLILTIQLIPKGILPEQLVIEIMLIWDESREINSM